MKQAGEERFSEQKLEKERNEGKESFVLEFHKHRKEHPFLYGFYGLFVSDHFDSCYHPPPYTISLFLSPQIDCNIFLPVNCSLLHFLQLHHMFALFLDIYIYIYYQPIGHLFLFPFRLNSMQPCDQRRQLHLW